MASCREIEPLLAAFVDGEANAADRDRVEEHLAACARCRVRAGDDAGGRLILRTAAHALKSEAPPGLRDRCRPPQRAANVPARFPLFSRSSRAWAMAAAILLVVAGAAFTAGGSTRVLAAELALDHLKCFALFERASAQADPAVLAAELHQNYGWRLKVPATEPALKLQLVGGRRCFSTDGRVAHILYRHDGRALSLFVMPAAARSAAALGVIGHEAIVWSRGGMTYAVIAREDRTKLARVAAYMQTAVE